MQHKVIACEIRTYSQQMHYEAYVLLGLFSVERDPDKKIGYWKLFLKYNELYEETKEQNTCPKN